MTVAIKHHESERVPVMAGEEKQHRLGQFPTPDAIADFMASLFHARWRELDLLDAGAGEGALTRAVITRLCGLRHKPARITVTAYELDETLIPSLRARLRDCRDECERSGVRFSASALNEDFIAAAVPIVRGDFFAPPRPHFNAALVNPPYRKIHSDSPTRLLLRSAGIEASNLYAGFVALIAKLLADQGELVAITPRSFCNGPYFKPFRSGFLETMSLRRLHVFESRSVAFSRDDVLQENIIVHAVKDPAKPERVTISSSSGAPGGPVAARKVPYGQVVSPGDPHQFIHLAQSGTEDTARAIMGRLSGSLPALGLSASSTGVHRSM